MDYKYTTIDEERRDEGRMRSWPWKRELLAVLAAILIAVLSSMATVGIMTSGKLDRSQASPSQEACSQEQSHQQFSCGETLDEAHQRGCKFDALTLSWLHPECSQFGQQQFLDISKASNNGSQWHYWEDRTGVKELGGYEALSYLPSGTSYWMTNEAHLYHCVWMLWRVYDAATTGKRLDAKASAYEHTKHCLDMLGEMASAGAGDALSQVNVNGHLLDIGWNSC